MILIYETFVYLRDISNRAGVLNFLYISDLSVSMRTICYYFNISFMVLEEDGVLAISVENSVFLLF